MGSIAQVLSGELGVISQYQSTLAEITKGIQPVTAVLNQLKQNLEESWRKAGVFGQELEALRDNPLESSMPPSGPSQKWAGNHIKTALRGLLPIGDKDRKSSAQGFPLFWKLFAFLLPRKIRERAYEPAINELREDYLESGKFKGRWPRRWLAFCFTVHTSILFAQTLKAWAGDACIKFTLGSIAAVFGGRVAELIRQVWIYIFNRPKLG